MLLEALCLLVRGRSSSPSPRPRRRLPRMRRLLHRPPICHLRCALSPPHHLPPTLEIFPFDFTALHPRTLSSVIPWLQLLLLDRVPSSLPFSPPPPPPAQKCFLVWDAPSTTKPSSFLLPLTSAACYSSQSTLGTPPLRPRPLLQACFGLTWGRGASCFRLRHRHHQYYVTTAPSSLPSLRGEGRLTMFSFALWKRRAYYYRTVVVVRSRYCPTWYFGTSTKVLFGVCDVCLPVNLCQARSRHVHLLIWLRLIIACLSHTRLTAARQSSCFFFLVSSCPVPCLFEI